MEFLTYLKEKNIDYSVEDDGVIVVSGNLDLRNTKITKLPEGLSVGGSLSLRNTKITELPKDLTVKGGLDLDAGKITNIAYRDNCGKYNRTIFAAYVNGEIQIAAGWFLGSLDEFESIINEFLAEKEINTVDAKKCKQAARECIKELEEII